MKTLIFRCEVKDNMDLPLKFVIFEGDTVFYRCTKVTEIHVPSDEEIENKCELNIRKQLPNKIDDRLVELLTKLQVDGAMWLKSKILSNG